MSFPFLQVKINRTRVTFTRRPTAVRSTTFASTATEFPSRDPEFPSRTRGSTTESQGTTGTRGVFRRRRPVGSSTSTLAPSTLAQEVNSLPG